MMAKWQEEVAAEQTTSRPTKGRPKSPQDSSYELDPDGDITLILNSGMSVLKQKAHQVQNEGHNLIRLSPFGFVLTVSRQILEAVM